MRYLSRRIGHALLVLLGVSVLSFVLAEAAPGDFIDELRLNPRISPATITALRERYALDQSVPEKYGQWLRSVASGDLGFSLAYERPVGPLLWPRVRNTLLLTVPATLIAWMIGVPVGAWVASRPGGRTDRLVAGATTALLSVPEVLLGLFLLIVALRSDFLPTGGMVSLDFVHLSGREQAWDVAAHFVLPVAGVTLALLPVIVRHVRSSLADALNAPFIHAGRAYGIPERRLVFRHALRAAANPLVSLLGLSIGGLLSASLVVEQIMSWPGLGPLTIEAVAARDLHLIVAAVTCSAALLVTGTLIADALLYVVDPRVRPERR